MDDPHLPWTRKSVCSSNGSKTRCCLPTIMKRDWVCFQEEADCLVLLDVVWRA